MPVYESGLFVTPGALDIWSRYFLPLGMGIVQFLSRFYDYHGWSTVRYKVYKFYLGSQPFEISKEQTIHMDRWLL